VKKEKKRRQLDARQQRCAVKRCVCSLKLRVVPKGLPDGSTFSISKVGRTPHASFSFLLDTPFHDYKKNNVYYYETLWIMAISHHSRFDSHRYRFTQ